MARNVGTETMYFMLEHDRRFSIYSMCGGVELTGYAGAAKMSFWTGSSKHFLSQWEGPYPYDFRKKNSDDRCEGLIQSQNVFFIEDSQLESTSVLGKVHDILGFKHLLHLHLDVSKLMKECTFKFLVSNRVMTKLGAVVEQSQLLSQMRVPFLSGVNSLLAAINRDAIVPGLPVHVCSKGCSMPLWGLVLNRSVRGKLEGNDYLTVDMLSLIMKAYIDLEIGFQNDANMTFSFADLILAFTTRNQIRRPKLCTWLWPRVIPGRTLKSKQRRLGA